MNENKLKSLLKEYHVPAHILKHMEMVAAVALYIADKLIEKGHTVDKELLKKACLLHDLVKTCEIEDPSGNTGNTGSPATPSDLAAWRRIRKRYGSTDHIDAAFRILSQEGEHIIAKIILKHRYDSVIDPLPSERPETWEEKLLYYADKRVMHDRIVSVTERLKDGRRRYTPHAGFPLREKRIEKAILSLEKEICEKAGILPDDLLQVKI